MLNKFNFNPSPTTFGSAQISTNMNNMNDMNEHAAKKQALPVPTMPSMPSIPTFSLDVNPVFNFTATNPAGVIQFS